MKILLINLIMLFCLLYPIANAQTVTDLYTTSVENDENSPEKSLKQALTKVLIKLTGDYKLPSKFGIQSQLKELQSFVKTSENHIRKTDSKSILTVNFDPAKVDALLQKFNLARWDDKRPNWLVWIILDTGDKPVVVNSEEMPVEANILLNQAEERGLPLLLPLLDLEERATMSLDDFIQANRTAVTAISQPYAPDVILLGHVTQQENTWKADWNLYTENPVTPWNNKYSELSELLTVGINKAVDIISAQSIQLASAKAQIPPPIQPIPTTTISQPVATALVVPSVTAKSIETVTPPITSAPIPIDTTKILPAVSQPVNVRLSQDEFELKVVNVPNLEAYITVHNYLRELKQIDSVFVLRMQPDQVSFRVTVKGGIATLEQTLTDDGLLVPQSIFTDEIVYRLQ